MLNKLIDDSYEHCVKGSWFGGIGNRDLIESEKKCIVGYTEKKIAALLRTGSRYQEAETKKMQQLQELLLKQQQEQNNK